MSNDARITFEPGKFYVMDRFAFTMQDAYVSGPFDTYLEAERDRAERNIADDCETYAVPPALLDSLSEPMSPVDDTRVVACPTCTGPRDFDDPADCPQCHGTREIVL